MSKKYKLLVYSEAYPSKKESRAHSGKIKNHILECPKEYTMQELAKAIAEGHPIALGYGTRSPFERGIVTYTNARWEQQQLIAIDVDNTTAKQTQAMGDEYLSLEDALKICKENDIPPSLVYHTYSHMPSWEHYRIIWALDRIITDENEYSGVIRGMYSYFVKKLDDGGEIHYTDERCSDLSRIFYGGKDVVLVNQDAVVSADKLIKKGASYHTVVQKTPQPPSRIIEEDERSDCENRLKQILRELDRIGHGINLTPDSLESLIGSHVEKDAALLPYIEYIEYGIAKQNTSLSLALQGFVNDQYASFHEIPLNQWLLGTDATTVHCILPGHDDKHPSAGFYYTKQGWRYHCFACGVDYDIFQLLQRLSGYNHFTVRKYLCKKFGLEYETPWQAERRAELEDLDDYLHNEYFQVDYPELYQVLLKGRLFGTYHMMIETARRLILDHAITNDEEQPLFFLTKRSMLRLLPTFGLEMSEWVLTKNINTLARYGLIEILPDERIPVQFLNKMRRWQVAHHYRYRPNVYTIPLLSPSLAEYAVERAKADKKNNIRRRKLGRAQIKMLDSSLADSVYVQQRGEELSETVLSFYEKYKSATKNILKTKRYTCEQEICSRIKRGYQRREKENLSAICMPRLLKELNLERVPFTKQIEKDYGVVSTRTYKYTYGASRIIIPKGDNQEK